MAAQRTAPHGAWTGGLCDCGGFGQFLGACCCYPCYYGKVAARMKTFPRDPKETGFSWFNGDCCIMYIAACFGVTCIPALMKRTEHREDVGIQGSSLGDCCVSTWCAPCALTQQSLDIKTRAEASRLVDHNGAPNQAYVKPEGGMNYASRA